MTQDRRERTCSLCEQQFDSDRELQEHQSEAHPSEIAEKESGYARVTVQDRTTLERARSSETKRAALKQNAQL